MKTIKTSKLIEQEKIATSITITPISTGFKIRYFLKEKTQLGIPKIRTIKVEIIEEDIEIPNVSNDTVKNLYKTYQYYKKGDFYINFYKK